MDKLKEKKIKQILNNNDTIENKSYKIGLILNQHEEDILKIIQKFNGNKKNCMLDFDLLHTAHTTKEYEINTKTKLYGNWQ